MGVLKSIPKNEVEIGMFIHALDGSWFSHPFWKKRFLLSNPADLDALLESAVSRVTIDVSKGKDVDRIDTPPQSMPAKAATAESAPRARTPAKRPQSIVDAASDALPAPGPSATRWMALDAHEAPDMVEAARRLYDRCSVAEEMGRARPVIDRAKAAVTDLFTDARLGKVPETGPVLEVVEDITQSVARNSSALISLVRLKDKDEYTYLHSVAVCALMVALARQLRLDDSLLHDIGTAGLLHDIGKMAVPDELLSREGTVNDREMAILRTHAFKGFDLLGKHGGFSDITLDVSLHHHERVDGTGYPERLANGQISLFAKMGAICDVYDAVTSQRPYKAPWRPAEALERMAGWDGHFDSGLMDAFVSNLGIYPVGTLVRMRSGRLGSVVGVGLADPTKPVVNLFYCTRRDKRIPITTVDTSSPGADDAVESHERPERFGYRGWEKQWQDLVA